MIHTHFVEAPGRVNLIGEHIDYCGLPVLPMAIQRRIRLAFSPRADGEVTIVSESAGFGMRSFELGSDIPPYEAGDWGNYAKAAALGLVRHLGARPAAAPLNGFDGQVISDLPAAAGLSSSSALVVAVALAILEANGITMDRLELASLLAEAERYVGLAGGGMDQAICLLGEEGFAAHIGFDPLIVAPVQIPTDWRFIVAHSLESAEKSAAARDGSGDETPGAARAVYNARTRESGEALECAWALLDLFNGSPSYREILDKVPRSRLAWCAERLPDPLGQRFWHVVTEARRVTLSISAMDARDLPAFGRLLSESHRSLRDDFEVSTPALDELCRIAESAGAAGARLTGAGLGGCAIAACEASHAATVVEALREEFYKDRFEEGNEGHEVSDAARAIQDALFEARPSAGARVRLL